MNGTYSYFPIIAVILGALSFMVTIYVRLRTQNGGSEMRHWITQQLLQVATKDLTNRISSTQPTHSGETQIGAGVRYDYLATLGRVLVGRTGETLDNIVGNLPQAIKETMSEREYLVYLRKRVDGLQEGNLYAACGQKTWSLDEIYDYWASTERAVARGVTVRRIFLDVNHVPDIKERAKKQKAQGIDVKNLSAVAKQNIPGLESLPLDLGFVVLVDFTEKEKEAIIHWGTAGNRVGVRVEEKLSDIGVVDSLKAIFDIIYSASESCDNLDTLKTC